MKPKASSVRQRSVVFVVLRVAPGMHVLITLRLTLGQVLPDESRMLRPALLAIGFGVGEARLLAAPALDDNGLGLPPVDLALLYLFDVVARAGTLDYLRH